MYQHDKPWLNSCRKVALALVSVTIALRALGQELLTDDPSLQICLFVEAYARGWGPYGEFLASAEVYVKSVT